ncbi:MAG TPA: hypothetical protein VMI32_07430 [Candidatus Solibacter sp.]|nr:hypothetical protein [Candidatus Solibacter sp.]
MLHAFFFAMSYLTDYHGAAEVMRGAFTLGLTDAAAACVVVACLAVRAWRARHQPASRPPKLGSNLSYESSGSA